MARSMRILSSLHLSPFCVRLLVHVQPLRAALQLQQQMSKKAHITLASLEYTDCLQGLKEDYSNLGAEGGNLGFPQQQQRDSRHCRARMEGNLEAE